MLNVKISGIEMLKAYMTSEGENIQEYFSSIFLSFDILSIFLLPTLVSWINPNHLTLIFFVTSDLVYAINSHHGRG
jgi:uncharacterized membrane protein YqhA